MKYFSLLLLTLCTFTFSLAYSEEPQQGEVKWVCISKEQYNQIKQESQVDEMFVASSCLFGCGCDKDGDCDEDGCRLPIQKEATS